jgi:hypothetical protein
MGCDIHLQVEKKTGDKWEIVTPIHAHWRDGKPTWSTPLDNDDKLPDPTERYYAVFSFLADVRNHENRIEPQFADRGFPDDAVVHPVYGDMYHLGDHSYTYASLTELLNAPWKESKLEDSGFYRWCNEILLPLADGNTDNIRVLMGFDS